MLGKLFKWLGLPVLALLALAGAFAAHEWNAEKPFFVNNFYNRAFIKFILRSPEQLTSMGILESIGLYGHNAKWDDESLAAEEAEIEYLDEIMRSMARYADDELSQDELVSKRVVMELLGDPQDQRRYRYHNYPINQISGLQISIPRFLDTFHRVREERDAEHYIARLAGVEQKMEQAMEGLRVREEKGIIPPTFVIERSLEIMRDFVAQPVQENVLYVSLGRKAGGGAGHRRGHRRPPPARRRRYHRGEGLPGL